MTIRDNKEYLWVLLYSLYLIPQSQVNLAEGKMQAAMRQAKGEAEAIRERAKAHGASG